MIKRTLSTLWRLGPRNVLRAVIYRVGIRTRWHPVLRVRAEIGGQRFFRELESVEPGLPPSRAWGDFVWYFGWFQQPTHGSAPDWFLNPFNGRRVPLPLAPWWERGEFAYAAGDIKVIWEPSRFDWVVCLAQDVRRGDTSALATLNAWLADWCRRNPCYLGPNWRCGQEASIRVLHLALASRLLGQPLANAGPDLERLIVAHLVRIEPTVAYARAQDNNHGTSEAAALFVGGAWARLCGVPAGRRWERRGRQLLEERIDRLFLDDGSFSQHSVNYHRLVLDTLSITELLRAWIGLPAFSDHLVESARRANRWLDCMLDPRSGDAPNVGGNDGSKLIQVGEEDYRDHRLSVQVAARLFGGCQSHPSKYSLLRWFDFDQGAEPQPATRSEHFPEGGYACLESKLWWGLLKYPRRRFRPHHCDALHLDLWYGSLNLTRDAGTFSYNASPEWSDYVEGERGHSTVEMDGGPQMRRLGRFLRSDWIEVDEVKYQRTAEGGEMAAGYADWRGCRHWRYVRIDRAGVLVIDRVRGFHERAVLRWRLPPADWCLQRQQVAGAGFLFSLETSGQPSRVEIVEGWESRYYMRRTAAPVLEIEVGEPAEIVTRISRTDAMRNSQDAS